MLSTEVLAELCRYDEKTVRRALVLAARPPRRSFCSPQQKPLKNWVPKAEHLVVTRDVLCLVRKGIGTRSAPFATKLCHKFFCGEVAAVLMLQSPNSDTSRSKTAAFSLRVASIIARVYEEAMSLKNTHSAYDGAALVIQKTRDDPGWSRQQTKGSGVAFNGIGKDLFEKAIELVLARL